MDKQVKSDLYIHLDYLMLRYPLLHSELEDEYYEYNDATGRKDFVGFEIYHLRNLECVWQRVALFAEVKKRKPYRMLRSNI